MPWYALGWLGLVLGLGACKKPQKEPGEACDYGYECDYMNHHDCYRGVCRVPAKHLEACGSCEAGLFCVGEKCLLGPEVQALGVKAAADKERGLLEQSGVKPSAEVATPAPADGARVRTVKATATQSAFAACRGDERLIAGGCKGKLPTSESYPSGQSAEDTVGARWNCTVTGQDDVTAYALCEKVP